MCVCVRFFQLFMFNACPIGVRQAAHRVARRALRPGLRIKWMRDGPGGRRRLPYDATRTHAFRTRTHK